MAIQTEDQEPDSGVKSEVYKKHFEGAVEDAQYLLMYASTQSLKDIDQLVLERLISARRRAEKWEELSAEEEADFWVAYHELRRLIHPTTVESIKANLSMEHTSNSKPLELIPALYRWWRTLTTSKARRTVNRHVIFGAIVLILVLFLQIYWVVGNQLSAQLGELLNAEQSLIAQKNESPQKYNQKDFDSFESQLLQTSLIFLDWSSPWNGLIANGDSILGSKYGQQIGDMDAKIKNIDVQLLEDPKGITAAGSHKDTLEAFKTQLTDKNDQTQIKLVEEKIALIDQKSFFEKELSSLDDRIAVIQGQINEKTVQKSALEVELVDIMARREENLRNLTDQKSALNARLIDIKAQMNRDALFTITPDGTGIPNPTSTPTSTQAPPNDSGGDPGDNETPASQIAAPITTSVPSVNECLPGATEFTEINQPILLECQSILSQLKNTEDLLSAGLNSTQQEIEIQRQINDVDKELKSNPEHVAGLKTKINALGVLLETYPKEKDDIKIQSAQNNISKAIDEMIDQTSTSATQLDALVEAKKIIGNRIESLQSRLLSKQIEVDTSSNTTLQKVKEDVGAQIINQLKADKGQLEADKAALKRQEQVDSIREDSRPAQLAGQFVLDILQNYLLPLLYGILGAATYVLRSLSRQIKEMTYSETTGIQHLLHISLGALAGIMVGWFSSLIQGDSFVGSISPMAIAFLVGYNIELLFTKMDEIVVTRLNEILRRTSNTVDDKDQLAALQKALSAMSTQQKSSEGTQGAEEALKQSAKATAMKTGLTPSQPTPRKGKTPTGRTDSNE
jgi:hypothetical protein